MKNKGFSLVELAIVLVILGLLTGGVLYGTSLIQAATLHSIATEARNYMASVNQFRVRFHSIPGDFSMATRFWGEAHSAPDTCRDMDKSDGIATCNGNGNGIIEADQEMFFFWHHLANAGLISGKYEGRSDPDIGVNSWAHTPGKNCPASRFGQNTGYGVRWQGEQLTDSWFHGEYGHIFMFGQGVATTNLPRGKALTPAETWNLDNKFDDGLPGYGRIVTRTGMNPETPDCTESSQGAGDVTNGGLHPNAVYRLSFDSPACVLIFRNIFER